MHRLFTNTRLKKMGITDEQIAKIQMDFINSVYHYNDPVATHKALLKKLADLLQAETSNAKSDA